MTCATCFWWEGSPPHPGECWRHPPTAVLYVEMLDRAKAAWPNTAPSDWCGEHTPREGT